MQPIAINKNGPQAFILGSDGDFISNQLGNDQVWGLHLDGLNIAPFYLYTTYNLRAKSMRLFPNIVVNQQRLTKLEDFSQLPTVTGYAPGALIVEYCYSNAIKISFTCFLPGSDTIVGTISFNNLSDQEIMLDCELAAILVPMGKGRPIQPEKINGHQILTGQSSDLFPVLWMNTGPRGINNPYPALSSNFSLKPSSSGILHWAFASKSSFQASLEKAKELTSPLWHKSFQTQMRAQERQIIQISTGNPDWDSAFYLAQVNARSHLINLQTGILAPTFIRTRMPDDAPRTHLEPSNKTDLSLLDVLHLSQIILPSQSKHFLTLLKDFINRVDDQGRILINSAHSFYNQSINEVPVLASLCLQFFEFTQDEEFLFESFSALQRFFNNWWMQSNTDSNNPPSWQSPTQLQLGSGMFNFDTWSDYGKGLNISTANSPSLASFLYREAQALQKIAQILGDKPNEYDYGKIAAEIQKGLQLLWNAERRVFTYKDRQSQGPSKHIIIQQGYIQEKLTIDQSFSEPQRLQIHLDSPEMPSRTCSILVAGQNNAGQHILEEFSVHDFRCAINKTHLTTNNLFSLLNSVSFIGFTSNTKYLIETANYEQVDISCFLPLWSGAIEKEQIEPIVETHLNWNMDNLAMGIPETWQYHDPLPEGVDTQINILWNTMIIEGLAKNGYSEQAAAGFTNLMGAIVKILKDFKGFFSAYDINKRVFLGHANAISGLAPLNLYLQIAGIKILSPSRVAIWGVNPFTLPVEVHWRGLFIYKADVQTKIIFPNGSHYQGDEVKPRIIHSG